MPGPWIFFEEEEGKENAQPGLPLLYRMPLPPLPGFNQGAVPFVDVFEFARAMVRTADAVGIQASKVEQSCR